MRLRSDRVKVSVPGTVEGLGAAPGAVALAVAPRDEVTVRAVAGGTQVRIVDRGPRRVPEHWLPQDAVENHATIRALRTILDEVGAPQVGVHLTYRHHQPAQFGLGGFEAEVLAGLFAGWALLGKPPSLDANQILELGVKIGADPLRMRASLEGAMILALPHAPVERPVDSTTSVDRWVRMVPCDQVQPLALIPAGSAFQSADELVPTQVSLQEHHEAVSRAASLCTLFAAGPQAIAGGESADDAGSETDPTSSTALWRHVLTEVAFDPLEEWRASAAPASVALLRWLRRHGIAAFLSGSGPAVVCVWDPGRAVKEDAVRAGWALHPLTVDTVGLRLDV